MREGIYLIAWDPDATSSSDHMKGRKWDIYEDSIVMEELFPIEFKSEILGRSIDSIERRISKLREIAGKPVKKGRPPYRPTEEDWKYLLDDTIKAADVAEIIGISKCMVYRYRKMASESYGIDFSAKTRNRKKPIEYSDEDMEKLKDETLSNRECAELIGIGVSTVSLKRKKLREQGVITWERKSPSRSPKSS